MPVHESVRDFPELIHRWRNTSSVLSLAVTDEYIFAGTETGEILVYDFETYEKKGTLAGHQGSVFCLTLTTDQRYLFSGSSDSIIKVWDVKFLTEVYAIYSVYDIGDIFSIGWAPKHEVLYFGTQNASIQWIKLYERESYNVTRDPRGLPSLRFDKFFDSKGPGEKLSAQQSAIKKEHIKKCNNGEYPVALLEVPPTNVVQYAHYGYVYSILVADLGDKEVLISGGGDGTVKVWGLESSDGNLSEIKSFETDGTIGVLNLAYSDMFLYCGQYAGIVTMIDLATYQIIRVDKSGSEDIMCLAVNGDCLFKGTKDMVMKWDPVLYHRSEWKAHNGSTLASAVSIKKNGYQRLITGGNDSTVALWDITQIALYDSPSSNNLSSLSSNLNQLTVGNGGNNSKQVIALDNTHMLKALGEFVSYKTVSGYDGKYISDSRKCATFLRSLLRHFGADAQLLPLENNGNPIVFGHFKGMRSTNRNARILFYGHYDVIAAGDADNWDTDPYCMTAMDGYLYGRGVSDNKGPILASVFAAAQLFQNSELENDVLFLIEGEEECGSIGFQSMIEKHRDLIGPIDWILLSNSYWLDDVTPCLNYGLRGIINGSVEIKSGRPDMHSGVDGGVYREPTIDLINLLSKLTDEGEILVPRFYESVRKLDVEEEKLYDAIIAKPEFKDKKDTLIRKWRYPSLTVHKITVSGPGNTTVIPSSAIASISLRIVPDQDIDKIKASLVEYLQSCFVKLNSTENRLSVQFSNGAHPWIGDPENGAFQTLRRALKDEWGCDPLFIREGGSIPVIRYLEKTFGCPAAQLPCGQSSDGAHLDNERLRVTNFFKTRNILRRTFQELTR